MDQRNRDRDRDPLDNVGDEDEEEDDPDEYEEEEQQPLQFDASVPVKSRKKSPPSTMVKSKRTSEPDLPEGTRALIEAITQQQQLTFNQMMEHSKRENEQLKSLLREERDHHAKRAASEASASSNSKRAKTITEPSLSDESWWCIGTFHVRDNKTDQLCLDLRAKLGAINADPKVIIIRLSY